MREGGVVCLLQLHSRPGSVWVSATGQVIRHKMYRDNKPGARAGAGEEQNKVTNCSKKVGGALRTERR